MLEFLCWHLILCMRNIDILYNCINKVDVLQLIFDKMVAFRTSFFSHFLILRIGLLSLTVTLRGI